MNEQTVVRGGPDWWSRWMALGSLAVAGAALFYTYRLHSTLQPTSPQSEPVKQDGRLTDNTALTNNVATRDSAATPSHGDSSGAQPLVDRPADTTTASLSDQSGQGRDRNSIDWDEPMDDGESEVDTMLTEGPLGAAKPSAQESDPLEDPLKTPLEQPPERAPRLAEVRTTFFPDGQHESVTTKIANAGDGDAQISELIFRPLDVVELPVEASRPKWGETDDKHLLMMFEESDNRTSTQGKHGDYGRELLSPFNLIAGSSVNINLAIKNADHIGYGLRGQLTLRLSNGDDFELEEVTLAFVD